MTENFYDERDRLVRTQDPKDGEIEFTYDDVGNLITVTDEIERITTYN